MQSRRSLIRHKTGAAYAEALLTLPVYLAIFAGVLLFHGLYTAKLQAKSKARRAVWQQAYAPDCSGVPAVPFSLADLSSQLSSGARATSEGYGVSELSVMFSEFLPASTTTTEQEAKRWIPAVIGLGEETNARGKNKVMCNEQPRTTPDSDALIPIGIDESGIPDAV